MIDQIGNTDLIYNKYLSELYNCTISIKAEYQNPGMSSKDRPAISMIRDAEKRGLLKPGDTIVEASSGNTALGLVMIAKELGYNTHFFLSRNSSIEKQKALKLHGATLTICENSSCPEDSKSTMSCARDWCLSNPDSFFCNQYFNEANSQAHYDGTGPEIWNQSEGSVTHFLCGVGTGGTITGVGKYLKSKNPMITIIGVDSEGSILHDHFYYGQVSEVTSSVCPIEGIGRKFIPSVLDFGCIDEFFRVSDKQAVNQIYDFIEHDAHLPGFSSGAVLSALNQLSAGLRPNDHVVLLFADHGSRYMSKIYNQDWLIEHHHDNWIIQQTA